MAKQQTAERTDGKARAESQQGEEIAETGLDTSKEILGQKARHGPVDEEIVPLEGCSGGCRGNDDGRVAPNARCRGTSLDRVGHVHGLRVLNSRRTLSRIPIALPICAARNSPARVRPVKPDNHVQLQFIGRSLHRTSVSRIDAHPASIELESRPCETS